MMAKQADKNSQALGPRHRLVLSALRLFAEKGYEGASTREICEAAGANISAIRYYFGDKAGLYRAAFTEPCGNSWVDANRDVYLSLPLEQGIAAFFTDFLAPLKMGEDVKLVVKLHFREMVEPTGVWQDEIDAEIKPQHETMILMLQKHLDLPVIDDDLQRIVFAIVGMAVHFFVAQDVVCAISPGILENHQAIDILATRLAGYAISVINGELARRREG